MISTQTVTPYPIRWTFTRTDKHWRLHNHRDDWPRTERAVKRWAQKKLRRMAAAGGLAQSPLVVDFRANRWERTTEVWVECEIALLNNSPGLVIVVFDNELDRLKR